MSTTPGRLTLIAILVVVGAVAFGAIAVAAERSRSDAAQAVRAQTEPLLVQAASLYTALSDANATVATALLAGGGEPAPKRVRYLADLRTASAALATLTRAGDSLPGARAALGTVAAQLPIYSGLVESARANNRQNLPVGASYLRQASALLTGRVLPAADRLFAIEAGRLMDDYGAGSATSTTIEFVVPALAGLILLVLAQRYVARISRRIFNMPMLAATVLLVGVAVWGLVGLIGEQTALASAQRDGSDSVEVLSATQILLSRAQGDLSLALVNRGSDEADAADFGAVIGVNGRAGAIAPLIGEVPSLAQRGGTTATARRFTREFASYRTQSLDVLGLERSGSIRQAIENDSTPAATADRLSAGLQSQITAAQDRFRRRAADATSSLAGLSTALPLLIVLSAALALVGLRQRINEYR